MTDLAIVIVSWNVADLLQGCLRTVQAELAASPLTGEVWVVDNNSSDGTVEMVQADFPAVRLIASPENLGFAGGNNAALRAIGFGQSRPHSTLPQAVLLLNPDTEVQPGALWAMFDFLRRHRFVGIVGARLQYGDGSFQHGAFAFPGLAQLALDLLPLPARLSETRLNGRYPRQLYAQTHPFPIDHPLGAAMMVRREAIEQVGLLDERYRMYVEEVAWAWRINQAGWAAYCVPTALVTHFGGQSTGQVQVESLLNLWRSRRRFYRQVYGPLKNWLASRLVQIGMWRKIQADLQAFRNKQMAPEVYRERRRAYEEIIAMWQRGAHT